MATITGNLDLSLPGRQVMLAAGPNETTGVAQVSLIDSDGTLYAGGTVTIEASSDGSQWSPALATLSASGQKRFDMRGYSFLRASVGTAASARVVVSVQLTTTQSDGGVTPSIPFEKQVALGLVPGWTVDTKFGYNINIDTATDPQDIWLNGGLYTGQPLHSVAAETVHVVSTDNTDDTAGGDGALTVVLTGLNEDWVLTTETITLNGTTNVTSTTTFHRLARMFIATAGVNGTNTGNITATGSTTGNIYVSIPNTSEYNQSQLAAVTVPAGKVCLIDTIVAAIGRSSGAAGEASGSFLTRTEGGVYRSRRTIQLTTSIPFIEENVGMRLEAKTDILMRIHSVSDNNTKVTGKFRYYLIDA